jgi:hypothetical protein
MGRQEGDVAGAAANVEHAHPRPDAGVLQEPARRAGQALALPRQPARLLLRIGHVVGGPDDIIGAHRSFFSLAHSPIVLTADRLYRP